MGDIGLINIIFLLVTAIVGYLLGSLNSSVIVSKAYGKDIRQHGSGNAGTTNTLRVLGKFAALLVLIGDMLKGILACIIGYFIMKYAGFSSEVGLILSGIFAVVGHNWPVYFGFRGGKGVLTTFAVVLCMDWRMALICLGLFIILVAITKYVSLGSIVVATIFAILGIPFGKSLVFIVLSWCLALMIILRHRANIVRLLNGNENKITDKRKSK